MSSPSPPGESPAAPEKSVAAEEPLRRLERDGVQYTLIGTAHVSRASADAVRDLASQAQFDAIAVELCPARYDALTAERNWTDLDLYRVVREGKAGLVKAFQDATAVFDSSGLCVFTTFAWTLADIQPQIAAACEGDWSMDKMNLVGERIWNLEKQFNLAAGLTKKDDDLPPRLKTEPAKVGPAKGLVSGIEKMLPEYYELRGWDAEGRPKKETLDRLGLR